MIELVNTLSTEQKVVNENEILSRLQRVRKRGPNKWTAQCPLHVDRTPSLHIEKTKEGKVIANCKGCGRGNDTYHRLLKHFGLWRIWTKSKPKIIEEIYAYRDEAGALLFEVVRYKNATPDRKFSQRRPDARGGRINNLKGVRRVLFRLPELLKAVNPPESEGLDFSLPEPLPIYIVEGEADALEMVKQGFCATCNPMGAGKWREEYNQSLKGAREINVVADKDEPGRNHARSVALSLLKSFPRMQIRVVEVPDVGRTKCKDPRDYFNAGGTAAELDDHIQSKPLFDPPIDLNESDSEMSQKRGTLGGRLYSSTSAKRDQERAETKSKSSSWYAAMWKLSLKEPFPPEAKDLPERTAMLVRYGHCLQKALYVDQPFYIPGRNVARVAGRGFSQQHTARMIKQIVRRGIFKIVQKHTRTRGTRYIYVSRPKLSLRQLWKQRMQR